MTLSLGTEYLARHGFLPFSWMSCEVCKEKMTAHERNRIHHPQTIPRALEVPLVSWFSCDYCDLTDDIWFIKWINMINSRRNVIDRDFTIFLILIDSLNSWYFPWKVDEPWRFAASLGSFGIPPTTTKSTRAAAATSSAPQRPRGESVCSSSSARIRAKTAWTACRTSWGQWAAVFFFRVRGRKLPENHGLGGKKLSLNWINLVFDGVIRYHRYWMGLFCEKSGRWWWWLRRRRGGEWWMVGFSCLFCWCVILLLCLDMFGLKEWNHKVQVLVNGTLQKSSISIWQSTITGTVLMNSLSVFHYRIGTGVCGVVLLFLDFLAWFHHIFSHGAVAINEPGEFRETGNGKQTTTYGAVTRQKMTLMALNESGIYLEYLEMDWHSTNGNSDVSWYWGVCSFLVHLVLYQPCHKWVLMSYEGWMSAVWLFGQPLEVNMVIETSQFIDDVFWSKKNDNLVLLTMSNHGGHAQLERSRFPGEPLFFVVFYRGKTG